MTCEVCGQPGDGNQWLDVDEHCRTLNCDRNNGPPITAGEHDARVAAARAALDEAHAASAQRSTLQDPVAALNTLGAVWSDDFGAYASGQLDASQITCALCMCAPCRCPAFGTP